MISKLFTYPKSLPIELIESRRSNYASLTYLFQLTVVLLHCEEGKSLFTVSKALIGNQHKCV